MSTERVPRNVTTERRFRDALAQFATGVTIITARAHEDAFVGFTATSFNSVSLEPPLVIWSLGRRSKSLPVFERAERYAVNVLAQGQIELARRFSRPHADRFAEVRYHLGAADAPLLEGCAAWLECRHHSRQQVGDHVLFVGEVDSCACRALPPLVWHAGRYHAGSLRTQGEPASG